MPPRLTAPQAQAEDADQGLRPRRLGDFIGQAQLKTNLEVFIAAARARGEALDHALFAGPPGLGKTTLAQIVAAPREEVTATTTNTGTVKIGSTATATGTTPDGEGDSFAARAQATVIGGYHQEASLEENTDGTARTTTTNAASGSASGPSAGRI